ncbi:TRAP transporter small permease subunit [Chloroflexota bacterium]
MKRLRRVVRGIDHINIGAAYLMGVALLTLTALVIFDVMARKFAWGMAWGFDIEWFHNAALLTISLGYAAYKEAFVKIDLLTAGHSPRTQSILMIVSYMLFAIPFSLIIIKFGWDWSTDAMMHQETTRTAHFPVSPIKFLVVVGFSLMLLQILASTIRHAIFVVKRVEL